MRILKSIFEYGAQEIKETAIKVYIAEFPEGRSDRSKWNSNYGPWREISIFLMILARAARSTKEFNHLNSIRVNIWSDINFGYPGFHNTQVFNFTETCRLRFLGLKD